MLRLLLVLLMTIVALPVVPATCHAVPRSTAMAHHGHASPTPHDIGTAAGEMCLGCIPPSSWRATVIAAPLLPAPIPRRMTLARIDRIAPMPPALPPPRRG